MLLTVGLPVSLAIIMFGLGLGLSARDFARVAERPLAFAAGLIAQMVILPLIAFALVLAFGLTGILAVSVMILSFCPGGATSGMLTKIARGDVALSISLTAVASLAGVISIPLLLALSIGYFMGEDAPAISVTSLALSMFAITTVPVLAGLSLRHLAPGLTARIEPVIGTLAVALFVIVILAAIVLNWALLIENIATLGPVLILLNLIVLGLGLGLAMLLGLGEPAGRAMAIELGTQNGTLGITLGALITATGTIEGFSLAPALYGVTMYLVTLPFVALARARG